MPTASDPRIAVCFVCTGNICRSPTAEGVMRALVVAARLDAHVHVDSAGTDSYHTGDDPDPRTVRTARARGIELVHRARTFEHADFARFHHVIALDASHERRLAALAKTRDERAKIALLRSFEADAARDIPRADERGDPREGGSLRSPRPHSPALDVPDPYYGGQSGFDEVFDICERACAGLLAHLRERHGLPRDA